ncbi:hypothetical protein LXL04_011069 [Taraxacum kok-saghyz]
MATSLHLKLRGIFLAVDSPVKLPNGEIILADESPLKLTNPFGDIFTNVISAVSNFFQRLIGLFNQEFPPDSRDEQIRHWFDGATPYLIASVVLITLLCCWSCLVSCISAIFVGVFNIFRSLFRCISRCFCCCGRRMRAPGRHPLKIRRAAFEANPRGYFRDLRGQCRDGVSDGEVVASCQGISIKDEKKSMADNLPEKLKTHVGGIVAQVVSTVKLDSLANKDDKEIYDWLYDAAPYLIAAALFWIIAASCCRCLCGGRRTARMMNAPGRRSTRIPRADFQRDTAGYFRDLRRR